MRNYYLSIISGQRITWDAVVMRGLLIILSWIYTGVVMAMRWLYRRNVLRSYDLGRPVISVGNITWGGVGKTPIVEWIVKQLQAFDKNPVILMRGYMPKGGEIAESSDEQEVLTDAFDGGVPVIAQKDRVQGALCVPEGYRHDMFVLDDGFQHWRVKRDLDIVVIDAMNPFGSGHVLPRGILREPMAALKYADVVMISRADIGAEHVSGIRHQVTQYAPGIPVVECCHQPVGFLDLRRKEQYPIDALAGRPVVLASGIGNPVSFELAVKGLQAEVKQHVIFPDHCVYGQDDIDKISTEIDRQSDETALVITAKDAVKLEPFLHLFSDSVKIVVLQIQITITQGEGDLRHVIRSVCDH